MARASGRAKNPDLSGFLQVSGGAPQIPTQGGWGRKKTPVATGRVQRGQSFLFGRGLGGAPQIPTEGGWVGNATLGWGTYGEPLPTYAITLPVRP